jgi:pimeloyl-ACP methyl ester carboxylesterase
VGASARLRVAPAILNGIQTDFDATTANLIEMMYGPTVDPPHRQRYLQALREVDLAVLYADFGACDGFDVSIRVGEIDLPTLIICGLLDQMTPAKYSERLHTQIRHSELHLLDNTGHMAMIEQADATTYIFKKFLHGIGV